TGALATSISSLQSNVSSLQSSVSSIQTADGNFVALTGNQSIAGNKTFTGVLLGTAADGSLTGGIGAVLATHQAHDMSFGWDGTNLHFWIDTTNVATLANGSTSSGTAGAAPAKTFIIDHPTDPS